MEKAKNIILLSELGMSSNELKMLAEGDKEAMLIAEERIYTIEKCVNKLKQRLQN